MILQDKIIATKRFIFQNSVLPGAKVCPHGYVINKMRKLLRWLVGLACGRQVFLSHLLLL